MVNIADLSPISLETITAFDVVTGSYLLTMDEMQSVSLSQGEERVDITGKQGRKLNTLKRNKTLNVSGTNGLISAGLLERQTGGKFSSQVAEVMWYDYLPVSEAKATTTYTAIGETGNEIPEILVKDANGIVVKVLTQGASVAEGTFTYDPKTKALVFHESDVAGATEIVANYKRKIQANVLENMADTYSGKAILYIDLLAEDKCSNVYRVQIKIPKADFYGEFSMDFGDSQTVHSFQADGLTGACGSAGMLWSWTVFGANAEDAA